MSGGGDELKRHWRTVAGSALAASVGTIGLFSYSNGVFVPRLMEEAGFSRGQLSFATFALSVVVAILAPFAGAAMDRYGATRIIAFAIAGEAIAFAAFAFIPASFSWYLAAIVLLAVLGVGSTPPGFSRIITARFDKARGLALGIAIAGLGVMAITAPIWANAVLARSDWRFGYLFVAGVVVVLGTAGLLLIASDKNAPAGGAGGKLTPHGASAGFVGYAGWSALRTPLFWLLIVSFLLPALFSGGYLFHMVSLLRERGFSGEDAALMQSLIGAAVLAGRLGSGAAMDRFFAPRVASIAFIASALGCLLLLVDNPLLTAIAALGIGLTIGAELDIMAYTFSRYFGLTSFGRLYGLAYGLLITCGGLSPLLITTLHEGWNWPVALTVSALGTAAGGLTILFAPRFRDREPAVAEAPAAAAVAPAE